MAAWKNNVLMNDIKQLQNLTANDTEYENFLSVR